MAKETMPILCNLLSTSIVAGGDGRNWNGLPVVWGHKRWLARQMSHADPSRSFIGSGQEILYDRL